MRDTAFLRAFQSVRETKVLRIVTRMALCAASQLLPDAGTSGRVGRGHTETTPGAATECLKLKFNKKALSNHEGADMEICEIRLL